MEALAGLLLEVGEPRVRLQELGGHAGADADQVGLGLRVLLDNLLELADDLDRRRLLGGDYALSAAGRAGLGEDLPDPVGDVLPGHLDQAERRDLDHVRLRAVFVEGGAQRLQYLVAVPRSR